VTKIFDKLILGKAEADGVSEAKRFSPKTPIPAQVPNMKLEEAKTVTKTVTELATYQKELRTALEGVSRTAPATKKLWREGNKSRLIKIGVALIVFPDPSPCTEIIGAGFVAAGLVQKGIQSRAIYLEDVTKTFQNTLKEVHSAKSSL
jgi:hypothetical protein